MLRHIFHTACVTSDFPCARFRYEPWHATHLDVGGQRRQQWSRPQCRSRTERVGVHAGEERSERRPDRHEQQQHIADTRLPGESDRTTADPATPDAGACTAAVTARRRTPDVRGAAAVIRTSGVRSVGHGPVRGHSRVQETVARPTTGGGARRSRRTNDTCTAAASNTTADHGGGGGGCGTTVAGTSVGPVQAARRRPIRRKVRLQAAPVADKHGGRQANAAIRGGPASATAAADPGGPHSGAAVAFDGFRTLQANAFRFVVPQVQRAGFDHTGRLSRRRRRAVGRSQVRGARQPHAQRPAGRRRRRAHVFRSGNFPLTGLWRRSCSTRHQLHPDRARCG